MPLIDRISYYQVPDLDRISLQQNNEANIILVLVRLAVSEERKMCFGNKWIMRGRSPECGRFISERYGFVAYQVEYNASVSLTGKFFQLPCAGGSFTSPEDY